MIDQLLVGVGRMIERCSGDSVPDAKQVSPFCSCWQQRWTDAMRHTDSVSQRLIDPAGAINGSIDPVSRPPVG